MRPNEMVGELLALLGDPAGINTPPDMALRHLNSAQNEVVDMIYPFMPEEFRVVSTASGDGGNEYTLPTTGHLLEQLTVRATTTSDEILATELSMDRWIAITANSFYAPSLAKGQLFFVRRGARKVSIRPAPLAANQITYYMRGEPTPMRYDNGQGAYTSQQDPMFISIQDLSKSWASAEWETYSAKVRILRNVTNYTREPDADAEHVVISNTENMLSLSSGDASLSNGDVVEYEVYVKSNIPEQYHPLIVHRAWLRAENRPEAAQRAASMLDSYLKLLTAQLTGGP